MEATREFIKCWRSRIAAVAFTLSRSQKTGGHRRFALNFRTLRLRGEQTRNCGGMNLEQTSDVCGGFLTTSHHNNEFLPLMLIKFEGRSSQTTLLAGRFHSSFGTLSNHGPFKFCKRPN